jgi:hypothetical protein
MQEIDKNDVDISILFKWGTPVPIKDAFDHTILTVYVRLVGDAETNRARTYALRESAKLRELLKTPGSDERLAYIPDWKSMRDSNLMELVIQFKLRELVQKVTKEVLMPLPVEPKSDDTLEKHENFQKEVDEYPEKREGKIKTGLDAAIKEERKYLSRLPKGELALEAENAIIAELCERRMYDAFQAMVLTQATYHDPEYKEKYFNSVEEFENLITDFKDQLFEAYNSININTENLKKLPGAMQ